MSHSNLLKYISLLMRSDDALKHFIADPITQAENKYGLTKAERAVLRRTVSNLSHKSVNGFSMERTLGSYRRSLRLLQNVLHNVGSKMILDAKPKTAGSAGSNSYNLMVYFPVLASKDFTNHTNQEVGNPYAFHTPMITVTLPNAKASIKEVMDAAKSAFPEFNYQTTMINNSPYVTGIGAKLNNDTFTISADLSKYSLSDDYVFWFYTVNGKAGQSDSTSGSEGESFSDYTVNANDTVYWQLIAPDKNYGFQPCDPHHLNAYARAGS